MAQKLIKRKNSTKAKFGGNAGLSAMVASVAAESLKSDVPTFKAGDTVKVHVRIKEGGKERIQIFEGAVVARSNNGSSSSFTVRKISHGTGVERVFLLSSPKVAKVELVTPGKVRRAKLYYLRALEGRAAKIDRDLLAGQKEAKAKAAAKAAAASAAK